MTQKKHSRREIVPTLFVAVPSAQTDAVVAALEAQGLGITRADNICFAEIYAGARHFEAAIYDQSLSQEEQVSLAQIMRIRWPWMRLIRWVAVEDPLLRDDVFDWTVHDHAGLLACVEQRLTG